MEIRSEELSEQARVPVRVRTGDVPRVEPAQCSTSRCAQPARGGIRYGTSSTSTTSYSCTSGFLSRNTSGTWYMMTAGHCVDQSNGGDRYQNTYTSSGSQTRIRIFNVPSTGWSINGRVDGARGWIPDPAVWNPSRWVWYTVNAEAYQIHHKIGSLSSIAIGALVCRGGGPSLSDCGEVTDNSDQRQIDWGSPTGTKTAYLAYAEGICTRDGDSGGPVFSVQSNGDVQAATAYGIASTSNDGTLSLIHI